VRHRLGPEAAHSLPLSIQGRVYVYLRRTERFLGAVSESAAVPFSHSLSSPTTEREPTADRALELFFLSTPAL
jgi:hypothetical protein